MAASRTVGVPGTSFISLSHSKSFARSWKGPTQSLVSTVSTASQWLRGAPKLNIRRQPMLLLCRRGCLLAGCIDVSTVSHDTVPTILFITFFLITSPYVSGGL